MTPDEQAPPAAASTPEIESVPDDLEDDPFSGLE
jgi:hypothetical protein